MSDQASKPPGPPAHERPRRAGPPIGFHWFVWAFIVALVAGLIYYNALKNPFLIDDQSIVLAHPDVREPAGITRLWFHDYWGGLAEDKNLYRPITILSFHVNGRLLDFEPQAFRAVNVAMLAMIGVIGAAWAGRFIRREAAWLTAFFFVCHPANVESINSVVGRADLQALLGIVTFLWVQRNMIERGKWSVLGGLTALAAAALAVGSKESGLVIVPAALAQAWACGWLARDTTGALSNLMREKSFDPLSLSSGLLLLAPEEFTPVPTPRSTPRPLLVGDGEQTPRLRGWDSAILGPGYLWGVGIALFAAGVFLAARMHVVGAHVDYTQTLDDLTANPLRNMSFLERLPCALKVAWLYVQQVFYPDLSFVLTPEQLGDWSDTETWAGLSAMIMAVLSFVIFVSIRHWLSIVLAIVLGHYLIVGQMLVPIGTYAANRLTLPFTLAAAFFLGAFVHKAIIRAIVGPTMGLSFVRREGAFSRYMGDRPWLAPLFFTVVLLVMSMIVLKGNRQWSSELVRATADLDRHRRNPICQYYLGTALANAAGDKAAPTILGQAEAHLAEAAGMRPQSSQVHTQLAGVLWRMQRLDQAESEYRAALRANPTNWTASLKLGVLLMTRADYTGAESHLSTADHLRPNNPEILFSLAELAKMRGQYTEATKRYQALLKAFPNYAEAKQQYEQLVLFLEQQAGPVK